MLRLTPPPGDVNDVHDFVVAELNRHPDLNTIDRMAFVTALIELATNVIQHADTGVGVTCTLSLRISHDRIEAQLSDTAEDRGIKLVAREMPDDELAESGRGIALIHALVDNFHYERVGDRNLWSITKNITRPGSPDIPVAF
ncbi:ATP-binding protein [Cryobacterium melibiosiphilum]|uniref:ATP-binding protein n=1 Tax=Cryobacterium melibiosiphilum TaxID=995039 RepID=UPI00131456D8|nr:ATP-binding protein [Cryobacterium melibiosiphilum]